jgi:hypothetical protein
MSDDDRGLSSPEGVSKPLPRPRRIRSASESLLSIVLGLEAFLVFFVALTAFGLRALEPLPAFVGGAVLIVVLIGVAGQLRHPWAVAVGWVLQGVLVATGLLLPIMYVIAAGFLAIWIYCFITGRRLDRAKAAFTTDPQEN